jgi:hypothetical protein
MAIGFGLAKPLEIDIEPRQIDEPPLEQLHEDEWAWLLVYKYQEWLELNANFKPPFVRPAPRTPLEVRDAANWKSNFAFVKTMYDQGLPLSAWKGHNSHTQQSSMPTWTNGVQKLKGLTSSR